MVAAAGFDLKSIAVLEPASSKLVEAGFSYMEKLAGFCDSNATGVEFMKGLQNKLAWESVGELAFFIAPIERIQRALGIPDFRSLFGGVFPPPFATLRPPPSPRQKAGQWLFRAKCSFPLLNRLSSLLNRRRHAKLRAGFPRHMLRSLACRGILIGYGVRIGVEIRSAGGSIAGDRGPDTVAFRRESTPNASRRDGIGKDIHHGERHPGTWASNAHHVAQQDAGRTALQRVQAVLPAQCRGVFCQLFRLLSARGLYPAFGHLY